MAVHLGLCRTWAEIQSVGIFTRWLNIIFNISVCLSVAGSRVAGLLCDDISTQACQLLAVSKPDLCNDTSISQTTCPRYCNKCGEYQRERERERERERDLDTATNVVCTRERERERERESRIYNVSHQ